MGKSGETTVIPVKFDLHFRYLKGVILYKSNLIKSLFMIISNDIIIMLYIFLLVISKMTMMKKQKTNQEENRKISLKRRVKFHLKWVYLDSNYLLNLIFDGVHFIVDN